MVGATSRVLPLPSPPLTLLADEGHMLYFLPKVSLKVYANDCIQIAGLREVKLAPVEVRALCVSLIRVLLTFGCRFRCIYTAHLRQENTQEIKQLRNRSFLRFQRHPHSRYPMWIPETASFFYYFKMYTNDYTLINLVHYSAMTGVSV